MIQAVMQWWGKEKNKLRSSGIWGSLLENEGEEALEEEGRKVGYMCSRSGESGDTTWIEGGSWFQVKYSIW